MNIRIFLLYSSLFINTVELFGKKPDFPRLPQEKNTVRILTLNTALLTVFFGTTEVNLKNNHNRASLIGKTIRAMSPQPDIVVIQEGFDGPAVRDSLYPEIKSLYPYVFFDLRDNALLGGVDSGLAMFSKYPSTKKIQKDFTCWAGVEALARKGIMGAELFVNGCPFYMFTAHFQAGVAKDWYYNVAANARKVADTVKDWFTGSESQRSCEGKDPNSLSSQDIGLMELRQAKKEIDAFVTDKSAPVVFAGDFNISRMRDYKNYEQFLKIFPGALDTFLQGSRKIKSSSWENGAVATTQTDRVDYAWLLNPSERIKGTSEIIDNFTDKMTDHLGILATIEFTCRPVDFAKIIKGGLDQTKELINAAKESSDQTFIQAGEVLKEALSNEALKEALMKNKK